MRTDIDNAGESKWDWSTVVLIVLAIMVLLIATLGLWASHPFENH